MNIVHPAQSAMNTGIYLHIPFCRARCSYCDFNTYVGLEALFEPYVRALQQEIRAQAEAGGTRARPPASTIFFGGGTPSLLSASQIGDLIRACRETFDLPEHGEITVECNPGTVSVDYLCALRVEGVNRLSFGAQSADPDELRLLGREHGWDEVCAAIAAARAAGFDNVNLDLIFGLPYQSLESWQRTVEAALELAPDHISLYALTIEVGTPMHDWTRRGEVPLPDPDLAADMYAFAEQALGTAGFEHYEISNWCKPGRACAHNLIYWRNEPYYGLGAGAHGSTIRRRYWKVKRPADYIARVMQGAPVELGSEEIDEATSRGETMMLGLRLLNEGVDQARFAARYGAPIAHFYASALEQGVALGLLEVTDERIRLTERGRFISNQAMRLFL
ncbi:MAG: radical SAM family heme chaperone HemW [Anaerolineae bacterium]|nr:radical SAM family heme chaperone HemW [Anaerolineae bacterium]